MTGMIAALLLASADWTATDTALEATYAAVHVADWLQTRDIAARPERFREYNPILGRHPSTAAVNTYFAANLVAHAAVSYLLPKKLRHGWQSAGIVLEVAMIQNNARAGISFRF